VLEDEFDWLVVFRIVNCDLKGCLFARHEHSLVERDLGVHRIAAEHLVGLR